RDRFGIFLLAQRFHLLAQLFLDADVGPALPVGDLAQVADARGERLLRGLQTRVHLLEVLARRQRRDVLERGTHVAQRAVGGFERQIFLLHQRLDAAEQLIHPVEAVAPGPGFVLLVDAAALGFAGRRFPIGFGRGLCGRVAFASRGVFLRRPLGLLAFAGRGFFGRDGFGRDPRGRFGARRLFTHRRRALVFFSPRLGRHAGGFFIALSQHLARALARGLVLRALGDLLEVFAIAQPVDGGGRRVLEVAVHRKAEKILSRVQALERRETNR